jgi:hypothetical protein
VPVRTHILKMNHVIQSAVEINKIVMTIFIIEICKFFTISSQVFVKSVIRCDNNARPVATR